MTDGAAGFSMGSTETHRTGTGRTPPPFQFSVHEMNTLATAFHGLSYRILQTVDDFSATRRARDEEKSRFQYEYDKIKAMARVASAPPALSDSANGISRRLRPRPRLYPHRKTIRDLTSRIFKTGYAASSGYIQDVRSKLNVLIARIIAVAPIPSLLSGTRAPRFTRARSIASMVTRLALIGMLAFTASSSARAMEVSDALRDWVDLQLFNHDRNQTRVVFKHSKKITIGFVSSEDRGSTRFFRTAQPTRIVVEAYKQVLPPGIVEFVDNPRPNLESGIEIHLVDAACAGACWKDIFTKWLPLRAGEFTDFERTGTRCGAAVAIAKANGGIRRGVAIIDSSISNTEYTACLAQSIASVMARNHPKILHYFMSKANLEEMQPANVIEKFLLESSIINSFDLLYHPKISAGMTRDEFWSTVESPAFKITHK
jgi:hypothetical protein